MTTRISVPVRARTDVQGRITPEAFTLRGQTLVISRVVDCRPARETKQGGQGTRYTVVAGQMRLRLLLDDEQRWYVEEEQHVREIPRYNGG